MALIRRPSPKSLRVQHLIELIMIPDGAGGSNLLTGLESCKLKDEHTYERSEPMLRSMVSS